MNTALALEFQCTATQYVRPSRRTDGVRPSTQKDGRNLQSGRHPIDISQTLPPMTASQWRRAVLPRTFQLTTVLTMAEPTTIEPGCIVKIHSLQSAKGMELNGQRAAVLRLNDDGRYSVKVEFDCSARNQTTSIKPENLKIEPRHPLPSGYGNRGMAMMPGDKMNRTLCELLLWRREGYAPPETMLGGYITLVWPFHVWVK